MGRSTRKNLLGGLALAWGASPRYLVLVAGISVVAAMLPPLEIWLGKHLIDVLTVAHGDPLPTTIILGIAFAAQRALDMVRGSIHDDFGLRVERHVMSKFLAKAASLDLGHLDDPATHDAAQRARREVFWVPRNLVFVSLELLTSSAGLLALVGMISTLHPLLGVLLLVAVTPMVILQRRAHRGLFELISIQTTESRERDYMTDLLSGLAPAKEIRSYGLADYFLGRYTKLRLAHDRAHTRLVRQQTLAAVISALIAGTAVTFGYAFVARRAGTMTPGDLVATFGAFAAITAQGSMLSFQLGQLDRFATFIADYFLFLALPALVPVVPSPTPLPATLGGVRLENVHFTYPRASEPALRGLDLEVKPGELVAIVGENGAGKTTITNLVSRFYDPDEGRVLFGGLDVRELDAAAVRARIGILLQDYVKYQLTLREAIRIGRVDRAGTDAEVTAALVAARAHGFAGDLDRRVGKMFDGGHELSGGEWQRLAVARLIYRQADLWILDEPTSNLDPEAEAAIFAELKQQLAGRMAIVISHRFSTVRVADRIYVVEGGRVLESGSHDELVAAGGRYAALFELQAQGYR